MKKFKEFNQQLNEKSVLQIYPDYESRKKALHALIDKRGDQTSNLSKSEQKEYNALIAWADDGGLKD